MGYRWIYSITVRTLLLVGGVVLVTLGIVYGKGGLLVAGLLLCAASIFIFRKMQQQLREKSWLMLEAIEIVTIRFVYRFMAFREENACYKIRLTVSED